MSNIDLITNAIIGLIVVLSGAKSIYLGIQIAINPDEKDSYLKKIKSLIITVILAVSIFTIKEIAQYYYG